MIKSIYLVPAMLFASVNIFAEPVAKDLDSESIKKHSISEDALPWSFQKGDWLPENYAIDNNSDEASDDQEFQDSVEQDEGDFVSSEEADA